MMVVWLMLMRVAVVRILQVVVGNMNFQVMHQLYQVNLHRFKAKVTPSTVNTGREDVDFLPRCALPNLHIYQHGARYCTLLQNRLCIITFIVTQWLIDVSWDFSVKSILSRLLLLLVLLVVLMFTITTTISISMIIIVTINVTNTITIEPL